MRKTILVRGPCLSQSGYGEHARMVLRALRTREDVFDIHIIPVGWGHSGWISETSEFRQWMDAQILKTQGYLQQKLPFDISVQVAIPGEFEKLAAINIGVTAGIETTKMSPDWIQKSNLMDKVITISRHAKWSYENTVWEGQDQVGNPVSLRSTVPIDIVGYPVRNIDQDDSFQLDLQTDYNYLTVGQWGPRKNMENLVKWWLEECWDQPVGLILKTSFRRNNIMDRYFTTSRLESIIKSVELDQEERECKIYLLHGDLSEPEMQSLYAKADCMISTTHGEGFGLPLFEFALHGKPIIAPEWSGHLDFLINNKKKPGFMPVKYDIRPVDKSAVVNDIIIQDSMWCYPQEASFKQRLRQARKSDKWLKRAQEHVSYIEETFSEEQINEKFVLSVASASGVNLEKQIDVAEEKRKALQIKDVKQRVRFAKQILQKDLSQNEKIEFLKDLFKGETAYVLSCGPTLMENNLDNLRSSLKGNLTFAIKQAYDIFSEFVDFHLYNCANHKEYSYDNSQPIVLEASTTPYRLGDCDLKFFIRERNYDNSISVNQDFDAWTFDKQPLLRPFGPGIMYEVVFYALQHLGVAEVITVGWDNKLIQGTAAQQHFYDKEDTTFDKNNFIHNNEVANNENSVKHLELEGNVSTNAILPWYNWLESNGCKLKIVSSINPAPDEIERIVL